MFTSDFILFYDVMNFPPATTFQHLANVILNRWENLHPIENVYFGCWSSKNNFSLYFFHIFSGWSLSLLTRMEWSSEHMCERVDELNFTFGELRLKSISSLLYDCLCIFISSSLFPINTVWFWFFSSRLYT